MAQKIFHPKIIIVLVNYNRWLDTVECLESIFKLSYPNYSVIVVDNNSHDNSCKNIKDWANGLYMPDFTSSFYKQTNINNSPVLKPISYKFFSWPLPSINESNESFPKLTLIKSKKNLGFAGGNNIATKFALSNDNANYFWYLNNDTVVEKDALSKIINFVQKCESAGRKNIVIGTKLLFYHKPYVLQGIGGKYNKWFGLTTHILENAADFNAPQKNKYSSKIDYPIGASMIISKRFIEEIGFMSEDYFLYFEELDWAERAKKKNWEIVPFLDCKIYHKESASIGNSNSIKSKLADYYNLRNRILITRKFFKIFLPFVYLGFVPVIMNRLKRGQFDRIKMILQILFHPDKPFN